MNLFYSSEKLPKAVMFRDCDRNKQILTALWQLVAFTLRCFLSSLPLPDCQIKLTIKVFHTALLGWDPFISKAPFLGLLSPK